MREPRNHLIDIARVSSVLVVVVFHALLYQISIVDGHPVVTPWAPGPRWWFASWFFMIMPVFFVTGGYAHAVVVDKMNRQDTGIAHYLTNRGRRLIGPLALFATFWSLVSTLVAWSGHLEQAVGLSRQFAQLLWFLTVYLVIVLIAPVMVGWHDRFGAWVMIPLAVAALAIDAWSLQHGRPEIRNLNLLVVWPLCHQIGIAYHRGWFRRGPVAVPLLSLPAAVGGIVALVLLAGYPPSAVGFADLPIANIQPPTFAMVLLAVAQAGLLGLLERAGVARTLGADHELTLQRANALLVTSYLWHIPGIIMAGAALILLGRLLPVLAPFLLSQVNVALITLVVLTFGVPPIGRIEYRLIPPLGDQQSEPLAIAALLVLLTGTAMVWLQGMVIHPSQPWSTLGMVGIWAGSWLMVRAADARPRLGRG